jgi:putative membrane protein
VVGILAFAKFLHWLLSRYEKQTMLVLLGFVLGSLVKVWPWANESAKALPDPHYGAAALWCVLGVALVLGVDYLAKVKEK